MYYISTRTKGVRKTAAQAIEQGLAADGGLYVPSSVPKLTKADWTALVKADYIGRANLVLGKFLTDFTEEEISACTKGAYGGKKFSDTAIAPLKKLSDSEYILELWHGPTCAFKDMALQILPYFMTTAIKKNGEDKEVVILVATSGDTGKAALEGFRDVKGTKIGVFYPESGVSSMQKLQMMTQEGKNVFVSGIKGNFDDAQNGVKAIFTNEALRKELSEAGYELSSSNSINWGRLVPQIVYYISAYCSMVADGEIKQGDKINICVPTGNFGNILAAYYAYKMGLPVNRFICASNANNVLTEFIRTGEYNRKRKFFTSISPSMDILISSNLERLLFDISGKDTEKVSDWMAKLKKNGKYKLPKELHKKVKDLFWGAFCDDYFTKVQIWKTFTENGYTLDPHTAVAVDVYKQYRNETGDDTKTVIASTASPFKFNRDVLSALGGNAEGGDFALIEKLHQKTGMEVPESIAALQTKKVRFDGVINAEDMVPYIKQTLGVK